VTATSEAISSAFARHQAGDLDAAEALYQEVLRAEPENLNGLQLLGVLIHQRGRAADAVDLLARAIAVLERSGERAAEHAALYNNMGNALRTAGRDAEAATQYRLGLAIDPNSAELHANLGNALLAGGDPANAVASYETALRFGPLTAQATGHLGSRTRSRFTSKSRPRSPGLRARSCTIPTAGCALRGFSMHAASMPPPRRSVARP
jgi:protein O-GlcNAc transferase